MKKINVVVLSILALMLSSTPVKASEEELKTVATKLCDILMKGDRDGFENMISKERKRDIQWWWDASGKGKYFAKLYGKCEFDKMVDGSKPNRKQVFIQRYEKDGVTKWGKFGTVSFEKNAAGEWKMISYAL